MVGPNHSARVRDLLAIVICVIRGNVDKTTFGSAKYRRRLKHCGAAYKDGQGVSASSQPESLQLLRTRNSRNSLRIKWNRDPRQASLRVQRDQLSSQYGINCWVQGAGLQGAGRSHSLNSTTKGVSARRGETKGVHPSENTLTVQSAGMETIPVPAKLTVPCCRDDVLIVKRVASG